MKNILMFFSIYCLSFYSLPKDISDFLNEDANNDYSSSILLSDSEVFTIGFSHFDPNEYLKTKDDFLGDDNSIDLKNRVSVLSLPFDFSPNNYALKVTENKVKGRAYLITEKSDLYNKELNFSAKGDKLVLGGYLEFGKEAYLSRSLILNGSFGTHIIYHSRSYKGDSPLFHYEELNYSNSSSLGLVGEINSVVKYSPFGSFGNWYLWSSPHYFKGYGANIDGLEHGIEPEGWYWANGVKVFYQLASLSKLSNSFYSGLKRVDIGGDLRKKLSSDSYYEFTMGVLMEPMFRIPLFTNLGFGITINYGSAFKGGSFVLFFNQI